MKFCEKCGNQLLDEAVMCPKCGTSLKKPKSTKEENDVAKNQLMGALAIIVGVAIIIISILWAGAQY